MRQTGTLTNAAWTALREVYPKLPATHEVTKDLERHFSSLGLKTSLPVQTNMIFIDLGAAGLKNEWLTEEAKRRGVKFGFGGRLVVHHQICPEAVAGLKETVETVVRKKEAGEYDGEAWSEKKAYGSIK